MQQVVVTGLGVVTPLGHGADVFWPAVLRGESAFAEVSSFDTTKYRIHRGAEIATLGACDKYLSEEEAASMGRTAQFALVAARLGLRDSDLSSLDPRRTGVVMGTTSGEPSEIERFNDLDLSGDLDKIGGRFISHYPCNHIPG